MRDEGFRKVLCGKFLSVSIFSSALDEVEILKENGQEPKGVFLFLLDSGFFSVADDANFK